MVIGLFALVASAGRETLQPLTVGVGRISLDPMALPGYALRTTLRLFAAMLLSLLVTFIFGAWAAKSRRGRDDHHPGHRRAAVGARAGLPVLHRHRLHGPVPRPGAGVELAAIFATFTSQAWNMVFSFYHSTKTVPRDLRDLSDSLRLGAWRRFWTLEAPYAAPSLIWNAMISMSGAWFFVVACGGHLGRRDHRLAARRRLLCGPGHPAARSEGRRHGGADHAAGHPDLRPSAVPPAGGLGREVPAGRRRQGLHAPLLGARGAAPGDPGAHRSGGPSASSCRWSPASGSAGRWRCRRGSPRPVRASGPRASGTPRWPSSPSSPATAPTPSSAAWSA